MQFGMYLYKQGIITAEQFVAAMELQDEQVVPLGVIAMEEGKLAVRDVLSILRVQSDLPNDRFGDIAIELGMMTKRDLAELLMQQSNRRLKIGDCLVELGILKQEQLDDALAAFRRERERGGATHVQHVVSRFPKEIKEQLPNLAATS
jgi:hypothetical protein